MAYWGYFHFMKEVCSLAKDAAGQGPRVIEIGVDRGQTLLPVLHYLSLNFDNFHLVGCDIHMRDALNVQLEQMSSNLKENQIFEFAFDSSLNVLPALLKSLDGTQFEGKGYFNLMLIDGDHNYYTVKREFETIPHLLAPGGIIIFDDYDGRWSNQDEFFIEREGYAKNEKALPREIGETESKKGVKPAVDEFLEANPNWAKTKLPQFDDYEPIILYRKGEVTFNHIK